MSDDVKPEVLSGDLISKPGVYMSRSNCAVEVRGYDHGYWRAEWEDGARWYHSSGTQTGLPARNDPFQLVRWVGPLAEDIPTTSEQIAEIEGQVAEPEPQATPGYTPPEGWRVLQAGEVLQPGDAWAHPQADLFETDLNLTGVAGRHGYYLRRIEQPENTITTDDATGLVGRQLIRGLVLQVAQAIADEEATEPEPKPEPQPVQVREGRWRTRGGEVRNVTPTPKHYAYSNADRHSWHDAYYYQTWYPSGQYSLTGEHPLDLVEYLGPIQPEPQPEASPVLQQVMIEAQAETIERLNSEIHSLNMEIGGLQTQLESVKAELVQQAETARRLQIELDAREQVPQAVSDRFEEGWDKGTAQAVETIAEWLEPIKAAMDAADNQDELARAGFFAIDTIRHLPAIMRSLTGLTDED